MAKYIDADRLNADLDKWVETMAGAEGDYSDGVRFAIQHFIFLLASLQQDETQVDKMLCSQVWWEKQGWIMIPPDATVEGIDSLLKQVRKKLQQEQPEIDLGADIEMEWDSFNKHVTEYDEEVVWLNWLSFVDIANYFYELGKNSK